MPPPSKAALTSGPIGPMLLRLTAQMTIGFIAMVSLNLMDAWFVSRLGTLPLAAIGFTFPVVLFVGSISVGIGIGTAALVSRAIGRGDTERARRLTTDALALTLLVVMVLVTVGILTVDPLFRLLGADDRTLPLVRSYMNIWWAGALFVVAPMVGNNAMRASGNMLLPSLVMMTAVVLNGILDPLLIFGVGPFPRMGVAGAALATVLARAGTFTVAMYLLHFRFHLLTSKRPPWHQLFRGWLEVLNIGIPAAGSNLTRPLGIGLFTALVAKYGPDAVAAFGVGSKVEAMAFIILIALATVIGPFVGQNIGAKKLDRVRRGIRMGYAFALGWGVFVAVLLAIAARPIALLFSHKPEVVKDTVLFLRIVPSSYGVVGVFVLTISALNVLKRPWIATALTFTRMFVVALPLALLARAHWGIAGVYAGISVSGFIGVVVAVPLISRVLRQVARVPMPVPPGTGS